MQELAQELEQIVRDVESRSAAEVVVVLAARSDAHREVGWIAGALGGWSVLAFLAWSPWAFHGAWFPVDAALGGLVCGWLAQRSPGMARLLVPARIRAERVRRAAEAAFVEDAVHATRARTGVLFYVSRAEGEVVVLADQGVLGRVPPAELAALRPDGRTPEAVAASLRALGEVLARGLPAEHHDNPDEIPDAPRIRP